MDNKVIDISGTHNRYMIKKYNIDYEKKIYRTQSEKWNFDEKYYLHSVQLNLLNKKDINLIENESDKYIWSLMNKEINTSTMFNCLGR